MMKRRIFLWMGLIVLFLSFGLSGEALAKAAYKAKRGDSISIIAKKHGVSIEALQKANGLNGDTLKTGQSLVIPKRVKQRTAKKSPLPNSSSYRVKKGDNLYSISRKTGFSVSEIKETNNLRNNNLKIGQKVLLSKKADRGREKTAKSAGKPTELADSEEEDGGLVDASTDNLPLREADNSINSDAELLGKWHNPEERKLLVKVATAFLGAPYRLGGISLRGLDCSAFVKKIYDLFDVSLPRTAREQASVGMRIAKAELIEGDLVFFNTRRAFGHVGIYIGNNEFVHASSLQKGVRISSLDEPYFNKRFVKAVRLKGLDEEVL